MPSLQGATLGERHRHYNQILNEAISKCPKTIPSINYEDDDLDNMLRIDIACHNRDIDYVLEVLKSYDMFYVSRALNKSSWLVEDQYSHIINPKYLHSNVFPEMMPKAIKKIMLHIRRCLKDEDRVNDYYSYVYKNNPKQALKWLPNCSEAFIKDVLYSRFHEMSVNLIKRVGRKSMNILKLMAELSHHPDLWRFAVLSMRNHVDDFLKVIETTESRSIISLTPTGTNVVMKHQRDRIFKYFPIYASILHLPSFVKYIKKENIKEFMLQHTDSCWRNFENLKPFLEKLPREGILEFLMTFYGISIDFKGDGDARSDAEALFNRIECNNKTFKNVYRWYEFAPLDVAFCDLKKFIYAESASEERHSILITLLKCCGQNVDQGKTVIEYYHKCHINEPYLNKIIFVNAVLDQYDVYRFDDDLWRTTNNLFHSLEVYIESTNNVQKCVQNVILYNVLRDEIVPEAVEEKFEFNSLKEYKNKIDDKEREKVFQYLFNNVLKKLNKENVESKISMTNAVSEIIHLWTVVQDWEKQELYFEFMTNKIIELCDLNENYLWNVDMKHLYWMMKDQKLLLDRSILLCPHEAVFINILKRDPTILEKHKTAIDSLCLNDLIIIKPMLRKLRIYWAESSRKGWRDRFIQNIKDMRGFKSSVQGIFILSTQRELLDFINNHAPTESEIDWTEDDEYASSIRKNIAKNMHLARPQLSAETILLYANGDYFQYTVMSLNTIYSNLKTKDLQNNILMLVKNAPESIQKFGIRIAVKKCNIKELVNVLDKIWKTSRNTSIRATIFPLIFNILCKELDYTFLVWDVFRSFIDDLNEDEDKIIYDILGSKLERVPVMFTGEFYEKSYLLLNSLPQKPEYESLLTKLRLEAENLIEYLDSDFIENSLLGSKGIYIILTDKSNGLYRGILAAYLLNSKDENTQLQKFNKLITPILNETGLHWKDDDTVVEGVSMLLIDMGHRLKDFVFNKKQVVPVKIIKIIQEAIANNLSSIERYIAQSHWKLCAAYVELLEKIISGPERPNSWDKVLSDSTEPFAKICLEYLQNDIKLFTSIGSLFAEAIKTTAFTFKMYDMDLLKILNYMLECKEVAVYITVLKAIPEELRGWSADNELEKIRRKVFEFPSNEVKYHYFSRYTKKFKNSNDNLETSSSDDDDGSSDDTDSDTDNSKTEEEIVDEEINA